MSTRRWMLPDGMEESMPPVSWELEALRRRLLDHYRRSGYDLVLPPLVEHLDTLLTGSGSDLEQQTFKFTDPASGRLLGLRADMTPQVARIAARRYQEPLVRLCYLGTVLRTRPDALGGARSPRQVGCEVFGEAGIAADLEILRLMLKTVALAGVRQVHLDLGHVGIYRALAARLRLDADDEAGLFGILQRKSGPDLQEFAAARKLKPRAVEALAGLMELNGDSTVLRRAGQVLGQAGAEVEQALETLTRTVNLLRKEMPRLPVHIDLAELRGYRYQTGLVYAVFAPGHGREIARGGRYDGVGQEFGRPRPATGFSADMNELLLLGSSGKKGSKRG